MQYSMDAILEPKVRKWEELLQRAREYKRTKLYNNTNRKQRRHMKGGK